MDASQAAQQAQAIQQIVNSVIQTVAIIAPLAAMGTIGVTEFAKKIGLASRWAGIFAHIFGFVISILVTGLVTGHYHSGLSILIGLTVAFGAPGLYSGIKTAVTGSDSASSPVTQ